MPDAIANIFTTTVTADPGTSGTSLAVSSAAPAELWGKTAILRIGQADGTESELIRATIPGDGSSPWTIARAAESSDRYPARAHAVGSVVSSVVSTGYLSTLAAAYQTVQDEGTGLAQQRTLNITGAGAQATNDAANNRTNITVSGFPYTIVSDTPEAHGARRDGKMIAGCAMTSGSAVLTTTDANASFTNADVGKAIHVRHNTASAYGFSTTIASVQSTTQATLAATAPAAVTNQVAVYGTDDTAAWIACLQNVVTLCQAAGGGNYGEVLGSAGIYMIASATTKGGGTPDTKGNAQIPLPVIQPAVAGSQKVTLRIGGAHDSATVAHWDQTVPQLSGCVLFSTLTGQTSDATYLIPSVLGGPTINIATGPTQVFSNMKVILDGIAIVCPFNPSLIGADMRQVAQCDVLNLSVQGFGTPDTDGGSPNFATKPTNSNALGIYMPTINNNDSANIGVYHCEGFFYGIGCSDHLTFQKLLIVYCDTAIFVRNVNSIGSHGFAGLYASVEACNTVLETSMSASAPMPVNVALIDTEIITGQYDIKDPNSAFRGYIGWADPPTRRDPRVNGGANVKIENVMAQRGALSGSTNPLLPGLPKSGGGTTTITGITQANPAVITAATHGLATGNVVKITGIAGAMVGVNGTWNVTVIDANTFSVPVNTLTTAYGAGGGVVNHAYVPGRDAFASIAGGTVTAVTIDGTATGLTSGGFYVPAGKKLELTYSAAPTMAVTLL